MPGRWLLAQLLVIAALWMSNALSAQAQSGLEGTWRAHVEHAGDANDIYLTFGGGDRPSVAFSIPSVRLFDVGAGRYQVGADSVDIPGLAWTLHREDDSLIGVLPRALVPHYDIPARFERASAPQAPAVIEALGVAPTPVWTTSLGAAVWGGLAYDARHHVVYAATAEGRVVALSGRSGDFLWSRSVGGEVRATPTLRGGTLYVATDNGAVALNARTGVELWRADFGDQIAPRLPISNTSSNWDHYSASIAVGRRQIVAAARDGCVYAFESRSGARRWRECRQSVFTGTPAIARGHVYVGDFDGRAYAFSLDSGAEIWRREEHGALPRDPVVVGDNVIFGSRAYDLVALSTDTGAPAWRRYFWYSWVDSPPTIANGVLYVGSSDALAIQAFDAHTGRRSWSSPVAGWSWPRVAVAGDRVYAGVVGGAGYLAPRSGALVAIDRATGALLWSLDSTAADGELTGFASAPVATDRRLYAADLSGTLYAFDIGS